MFTLYKVLFNIIVVSDLLKLYSHSNSGLDESLETDFNYTHWCKEKSKHLSSRKNNLLPQTVPIPLFSKLILSCHFCKEEDDTSPKVWFKRSRFSSNAFEEVQLGMHYRLPDNRVFVTPHHSLVINNVTRDDEGIYYCYRNYTEDVKVTFNYMVDVIDPNVSAVRSSAINWPKFEQRYYSEINSEFRNNHGEFELLRNLGFTVKAQGIWGKWLPCQGCTQTRKRIAECHLFLRLKGRKHNLKYLFGQFNHGTTLKPEVKITPRENELPEDQASDAHFTSVAKEDKKLKGISDFVIHETCYAPCRFSSGANFLPKYKNTITLQEGEHITLKCPEASLKNEVVWRRDGLTMFKNSDQGHVSIDAFSNLCIVSANKQDEGNYTCYIDNKKIQEIIIYITVRSKLTQEAFVRHMQYLGFIFLFSIIFYIAGVIIACSRKSEFRELEPEFFIRKPKYAYWKLKQSQLEEKIN
ncbi:uncharacterized protein LOC106661905 isoform X2 [Cimex lectularius]|uniref:Ig-like domain-containing protein n=1 Tax=Cimex lectularius TaxID=79782 RepID=A0A8I6RES6_CIMLE|nr:uncharacterized protein LOC106661905 isoform X2 [Cimex lectularius]